MNWNVLLFASKWVFIALIYFVLFLLLVTVRREFSQRITGSAPKGATVGRLRVVKSGNDKQLRPGTTLDLESETTIGAAPDNSVTLGDRFISGHHARLRWDGSRWWLEDLGSRNGTYVDGKKCVPYQPESVRTGMSIQMGDMTFQMLD